MAYGGRHRITLDVLGVNYDMDQSAPSSSVNEGGFDTSVVAATVGQLTTRTDADTGVITLTGGHTIITGKIDVYWATGVRRNMDGTVATNALTVDGGTGDNLPTNLTAVTVQNPTSLAVTVDLAEVALWGMKLFRPTETTTVIANISLQDATAAELGNITLNHPSGSYGDVAAWAELRMGDSPIGDTGDVAAIAVSHNYTSAAVRVVASFAS